MRGLSVIALVLVCNLGQARSLDSVELSFEAPVRYFSFSSDVLLSDAAVKKLITKYGKNIMIGGDSGAEGFDAAAARWEKLDVKKHVYLEGPGGPTGDGGISPDELARMKAAARSVGIDTRKSNWLTEWNKWGWKTYTRNQIAHYQSQGFDSAEIDNLYRGIGEGSANLIRFFQDQQAWMMKNGITVTLLLKNLSEDDLLTLEKAINAGKLSRAMFTDFHISEKGSGNRTLQKKISARMGIQTLESNDTYHYSAKGEYNVGKSLE